MRERPQCICLFYYKLLFNFNFFKKQNFIYICFFKATLGSIEKPEDLPSPPPTKRCEAVAGKLRIRKPRTSDGDNSPEESPTEHRYISYF